MHDYTALIELDVRVSQLSLPMKSVYHDSEDDAPCLHCQERRWEGTPSF